MEPKLITDTATIDHGDNLKLTLTGENYGEGPLDTKVVIEPGVLCWISWPQKDAFLDELKALIDKHAI